jgi:hypothetical protein
MFERLFPSTIDNTYRGQGIAAWLLALIVLVKVLMGLNVAGLNPFVSNQFVLRVADHIPIDSYGDEAAATVTFLFACWGLALLTLSSMCALILFRYRAAIPMAYLLLLIEQVGRKGLSIVYPVARAVPPGEISSGVIINWGLTVALALGFILAMTPGRRVQKGR